GVARQVANAMRDLRARRGDEKVVHGRSRVLLARGQLRHCALEMILDDVRRAAELAERRQAQHPRAAHTLNRPEPLEDELQVRRLDSTLFRRVVACDTTPGCAESNPAGGDLVEDGV